MENVLTQLERMPGDKRDALALWGMIPDKLFSKDAWLIWTQLCLILT